jgi:hypothetical protein
MKAISDMEIYDNFTEEQQHKIWNLALYAVNTGELYRSSYSGTQKSLYKKYLKGEYVEEQANKAFYNTISTVLKMYEREFDEKHRLTEVEKQALASEIRSHYTQDFDLYPNGGLLAV